MSRGRMLVALLTILSVSACTGNMILIPRTGGQPLNADYHDGTGQTTISVVLPSGETLRGTLVWIPPGGGISTALVTTGQGTAVAGGMASGNKGMFVGSVAGDRGTTMRIELLCNAFTLKCVGAGQTSAGVVYDIQR